MGSCLAKEAVDTKPTVAIEADGNNCCDNNTSSCCVFASEDEDKKVIKQDVLINEDQLRKYILQKFKDNRVLKSSAPQDQLSVMIPCTLTATDENGEKTVVQKSFAYTLDEINAL